jgi:hypothetical protein
MYVLNFCRLSHFFIQQSVIESGRIAVTIPALPISNFWLNSVQKQTLASQVSEKIVLKVSQTPSIPPIKRRESPYSSIECPEIVLGRFGPEREKFKPYLSTN